MMMDAPIKSGWAKWAAAAALVARSLNASEGQLHCAVDFDCFHCGFERPHGCCAEPGALHRSPPPPEQFVADSPLEGDGFEPSVPWRSVSLGDAVGAAS